MATTEQLVTIEELERLPADCGRCELIDGRLVKVLPAGWKHNQLVVILGAILLAFVRPGRLGVVMGGDTGIILGRDPDRVRAPDVCFVAAERLPGGLVPQSFSDVVPDLIVEVISPGDTAAEVQTKTEEWLRAGARLVWNV